MSASNNELFLTVSPSPHMRTRNTARTVMFDVIIALTPLVMWACWMFGMRSLTLTAVTVASCVIFELGYELLLKLPVTIGDLSAVVTGIILALNLPVNVPLWLPVAGSFFAIIIVKMLFGGIGKNIVNPALAARVFLFCSWSTLMKPSATVLKAGLFDKVSDIDAVASSTPLADLKNGIVPNVSVTDLLVGNYFGVLGEVSSVLILVGFIYLIYRKVITWHIPVAFISVVAVFTYFFPKGNITSNNFLIYSVFSGGLLFGAVFMATDYTTSPVTNLGRFIYGLGCGLITVFIRYFGGYPEGVSFAILIMNLFVFYLDKLTKPKAFGRAKTL